MSRSESAATSDNARMTHAPAPAAPTQAPKPQDPEPLQVPVDPEKRGTPHPPPADHEHPKEMSPPT